VEEKTEEAEEQDVADMEIDELLKEILGEDYQVDEVNTGNQIEINEEILVEPVLANPEDQTTMQIADSLSLNNNMTLTANAVNTLEGPLYLQNLGLGGIDILAGKIVIDQNGNASFGQNITVEGKLAANTIEPNGNELVIDLGTLEAESSTPGVEEKQLLVKGNQGETVASINASGSAQFKQLATEKLDIQSDLTATQSGAIIAAQDNYIQNGIFAPAVETNATSGVAYLPSNESQIMIYNQNITENSLIYITPSSNTQNKVLYVKNKKAPIGATVDEQSGSTIKKAEKGWFTVGIDQAINGQIQFNWWIIN
jgi:hypothetical protein